MSTERAAKANRLPLWLKLLYTGYVAVLVPVYWRDYGPTNFLYFCDVALLMTVAAIWLESPLLVSSALLGIFLVQMVWVADFLGMLVGYPVNAMTAYMFDPRIPLFTRFLSFFHFWLPFFLLGLAWRLGYDRRALWVWTPLAWVLLLICYFVMPAPPAPPGNPNLPVNINYVWGFSEKEPQKMIENPNLYLALVMLVLPLGIFLPSHLLFMAILPRAQRGAAISASRAVG
jgi:hypothetical protein